MVEFASIQNRDAFPVIRGYVYQVNTTIERWLDLIPDQVLELECGEDIDTVSCALRSRLLEQVKHREISLTLRCEDALKALAFATMTRSTNPNINFAFRYTTNAEVTVERPPVFEDRIPAIEMWEKIRTYHFNKSEQKEIAEKLKSFLANASKPKKVNLDIWQKFTDFIASSTNDEFLGFVKTFEWSTACTAASEMTSKIEGILIATNRAANKQEAETKYQRLFLCVFKLLCQEGTKRLTRVELEGQLALSSLTSQDQQTLKFIQSILASLETRVSNVEKAVLTMQPVLGKLASDHGIAADFQYASIQPIIDIPPLVSHVSRRKEAVSQIVAELKDHIWIALNGTVGSGKTQLAILLTQEIGTCKAWISLRDKKNISACSYLDESMDVIAGYPIGSVGKKRYQIVLQKLNHGDLIVFDDIPPLQENRDLFDRLLIFLDECASHNIKLISTSTFPLSNDFLNSAGSKIKVIDIPPFTETEVSEVLRAYGATPEDAKKWSNSVCVLSSGHPTLIAAAAQYLKNMQWKVSSLEQFNSLFVYHAYAVEINNDTTRRLIDTVQDSDSRELLYRLNLAVYGFDLEDVKLVSSVEPPVSKPIEKLTLLDGLWIQRTAQDRYEMSPLIKRLGYDDIPSERQKSIRYLFGARILSKRKLDLWDTLNVVSYFAAAEAFQNALIILAGGLHVLSEQETLHDDALLGLFWASAPFPPDVDLGLRILARSFQINVNIKLGRDVTFAVTDLGNLVQAAQPSNGWSVPIAAIELALHAELYVLHWRLINNVIAKAINIFPEAVAPDGSKLTAILTMGSEALIWLVTPNISTIDQLIDWGRLIGTLSKEALQKAFLIPEADQCCIELSHRVWIEEAKKDNEARQWPNVLDCFDKLGTKARELGLNFLWACTNRAKMIIHAEYLNDINTAKKIAEETIAGSEGDLRIKVLMKEYMGQQYYYQGERETARIWLEEAIEEAIELNPFGRLRSLIYLGAIVGNEDPNRAERLVREGVELARKSVGIPKIDLARALSELAIAQWLLAKDVSAAFDIFDEAGERLFACKKDDIFWKALFVRFAHVVVYFKNIALTGQPPILDDGQKYADPFRGMFFTLADEKLAERYEEKRVWACIAKLASFASATKNDERAAYWAEKGLDMARSRGQSHAVALLINDLVPHLLRENKYGQVLDMALESSSAAIASMKLRKEGKFSLEMSIDIPTILGPKPSDLWSQAECESALMGLLPTAFRILTVALEDPTLAKSHSEEVASICRQVSSTASSPDFWLLSAEIFSSSFSEVIRGEDLVKKGNEAKKQGHDILAVVSYMFTSMKGGYDIRYCVHAQLAAMPYVHHILSKHLPSIYRLIVLPFISRYWLERVQQGRFLFSSPNIVEQSLRESDNIPEAYRAQYILREVIRGLRMRIKKEEVPPWLNERPPDA
jgi:ribosomal protein L22